MRAHTYTGIMGAKAVRAECAFAHASQSVWAQTPYPGEGAQGEFCAPSPGWTRRVRILASAHLRPCFGC